VDSCMKILDCVASVVQFGIEDEITGRMRPGAVPQVYDARGIAELDARVDTDPRFEAEQRILVGMVSRLAGMPILAPADVAFLRPRARITSSI